MGFLGGYNKIMNVNTYDAMKVTGIFEHWFHILCTMYTVSHLIPTETL